MAKIKVLPVYLKIPMTFWSYQRSLEIAGFAAVSPPLGLATVAAMLPEQFEPQKIVDMNVEKLKPEHFRDADIIFTSSMVIQQDSLDEVIDMAHHYGKQVVSGGPFPTSYPERNRKSDFIVAGEAELTIKPFLEDFVNGDAKRVYTPESVASRVKVPLAKNGKPLLVSTPSPRWDLLDLSRYSMASLQYSRGCPWNCEFCDITPLLGKIPRTKSSNQMIAEFDNLYNTGFRGTVFIVDDNFIGNKRKLMEFLPKLADWQRQRNYPFSLLTEASINLAWDKNKQLLENMVEAGFEEVFVGIESVNSKDIEAMDKRQNLKIHPLDAVLTMQKAGIGVKAGFIVGYDGQGPEVFEEIYNFVHEAGIPAAMVGMLIALKNTRLHTRLEKEGRLRMQISGDNTYNFSLNFEPKLADGFKEQDLIKGYKSLLNRLYGSGKDYYERCRTQRKHMGSGSNLTNADAERRRIFYRFLGDQLLRRRLNLETAKYLMGTLITKPSHFPTAVDDVIKYAHFEEITRESIKADDYKPKVNTLYENFVSEAEDIYLRYGMDLERAKKLVSKRAGRLVARAEKAYHSLHEDFRERADLVLDNLRSKLESFV